MAQKPERLRHEGLPPGPWKACGADRGGCKCGQVWSADDTHIATAHHVSQAAVDDFESKEVYPTSEDMMKTVARAIAGIPEMLAEINRLRAAIKGAEIAITRDEDSDAAARILIKAQAADDGCLP